MSATTGGATATSTMAAETPHISYSSKGPWAPPSYGLGGIPNATVDVPICSVFLVIYFVSLVLNFRFFKQSKAIDRKFMPSRQLVWFSVMRVISCSLRISWAYNLTNVNIQMAAQILISAGTVMLYMINLVMLHRITRALHPKVGWHKGVYIAFRSVHASILLMVIMTITCTIQLFYTLSTHTRNIDHNIQKATLTYFTVIGFLPIPLTLLCVFWPKTTPVDNFGSGKFSTKIYMILFSATLLSFGASWRCAADYLPSGNKLVGLPWYDSKAWFYVSNFVIETVVIYFYMFMRWDRRFYVREAAIGPGQYSLNTMRRQAEEAAAEYEMSDTPEVTEDSKEQPAPGAGDERREPEMLQSPVDGIRSETWGSHAPTEVDVEISSRTSVHTTGALSGAKKVSHEDSSAV